MNKYTGTVRVHANNHKQDSFHVAGLKLLFVLLLIAGRVVVFKRYSIKS